MPRKERERVTFALSEPIHDIDGTELHELHLRPPRTKDLRAIDGAAGEIAAALALIARLAGVQESEVDEIEISDLMPIMSWLGESLPSGGVLGA